MVDLLDQRDSPLLNQNACPFWDKVVFALCCAAMTPALGGLFRKVLRKAKRCRHKSKEESVANAADEVAAHAFRVAQEKLLVVKLRQLRQLALCFSAVMVPTTFIMLYNIALGVQRHYSPAQDVVHAAMASLWGLVAVCPDLIHSTRTMNGFYCISSVLIALMITPFTCTRDLVSMVLFACNLAMLLLCCIRRATTIEEAPSLFVCNCFFALCASSTLWVYGEVCCFSGPTIFAKLALVATQVLIVAVMMWVASVFEQSDLALLSANLHLQETKELHSAACALLRSCCEVVVELDSGGIIVSPATDLGTFLLRGQSRNLQGTRIVEIIADEDDRRQFLERLTEPKLKDLGLAENMHVRARDGDRNVLHLELLWFQYHRLDGQRYMVGIREFGDDCLRPASRDKKEDRRMGYSSSSSSRLGDGHGLSHAGCEPGMLGAPVNRDGSLGSGASEERQAVVTVDLWESGFPIRQLNLGFRMRIGHLPMGVSILRFVSRPDCFLEWLQEAVNHLENGDSPEQHEVSFKLPTGRVKAHVKALSNTTQSQSQAANEDATSEGLTHYADLVFFNIQLRCPQKSPDGQPGELTWMPRSL